MQIIRSILRLSGIVLVVLAVSSCDGLAAAEVDAIESDAAIAIDNFDFLEGDWELTNFRLKERMSGSSEWIKYELNYTFTPLLNGLANVDRIYGEVRGQNYEALNFRAYDPDKDEWVVFWMSESYPHLTEQVRGRFSGGEGLFFGAEEHQGTEYKMRFRWRRTGVDSAYWDQSYQDPETGEWEINWKMTLSRGQ